MKNPDRGLIAISQNEGYLISWRLLGNEDFDFGFNVYRDGDKLNNEPITGTTMVLDKNGTDESEDTIRAVTEGEEQVASNPA